MTKKLLSFIIVLALSCGAAAAGSTLQLAFMTGDGNVTAIDATSLSMTVSEDHLLVSNSTGSMSLNLSDLVKMYFTDSASGMELMPVNMTATEVCAYTTDGRFAGKFDSVTKAMSSLPAGIYILKTTDNQTLKIAVR